MSFMNPTYPNLELLEFKARLLLEKDNFYTEKVKSKREENKYASVSFEAIVFPQVWGSTCLGIDKDEHGGDIISGCAMTKAYTSVFHETLTDTYVVFFGNRAAYRVSDAPKQFYEDLKNRQMAPLSRAMKEY